MAPTSVRTVEPTAEAMAGRVAIGRKSIVTVTGRLPVQQVRSRAEDDLRRITVFAGAWEI